MSDIYQERYQRHQDNKKHILATQKEYISEYDRELLNPFIRLSHQRHSNRIYSGEEVRQDELRMIELMAETCPSSCNRKAISLKTIENKEDIQLLETLLVGGKGWIGKADKIILLWADMLAYKSPNEIDFMPYLDAGVVIQEIYLTCSAMGVKCCFVNPNIREENREFFKGKFGDKRFCGAMILGK